MLKVLIYVGGLLTGVVLMATIRRCTERAAQAARKAAFREFSDRRQAQDEAYNRGYNRAKRDYRNMNEIERFADAFEGRKVKMQVHEVQR